MLVIGVFSQTIELEQALAELENYMIPREHILVAFMDKKATKNEVHNPHPFEIGIAFGTAFAVIGAAIGFSLTLGPIIWGLIGAIVGYLVGVGTYVLIKKRGKSSPFLHETTVIIQCSEEQSLPVRKLLWEFGALSVGKHPK